jgi:cytochrome c-type biogenesis protein CcmH
MTPFVVGAVVLLLVAAGLLLWQRDGGPRSADRDDPNLDWLRQRRRELGESGEAALLEDLGLRVLEEESGDPAARMPAGAGTPPRGATRRLGAVLTVTLVVLSGLLYLRLGALEDVLIYRDLENLPQGDTLALQRLTQRVRERAAERPENLYYLDLLGQLEMTGENAAEAAQTFQRLAEQAPEDARLQAQAAQAMFQAAGRRLNPEAQLLAERALALNPTEGRALGLLGMASFQAGQYNAAVAYWERLQALEEPGSDAYQMLSDVLRMARQRAGLDPDAVAAAPAAAPAAGDAGAGSAAVGPGIQVALSLPAGADVDPAATVFVFARNPGAASRMPIAVRRLRAADLPLRLRLSDADSMAGQLLSQAESVVVSAQVSRDGRPGEASALFAGSSAPVRASDGPEISIQLQAVTGG